MMGDEFHAVLKLITGEEIFSLVSVDENDGDSIIMLSNPVIMKMLSSPAGKYVKVKPWLELPDQDLFLIKYDKNTVDDKFMASIISFIFLYLVIFFLITAFLSLSGLDFVTSISGAATSISNVGPGLGPIIGPNGNFSMLPDISKWILSLGMILGRLELFAILVLFLPSFWRN